MIAVEFDTWQAIGNTLGAELIWIILFAGFLFLRKIW